MITNLLRVLLTRSWKPLSFTDDKNYELKFGNDELGIYVHIPFCAALCPFCPYNKVKYDRALAEAYKDALIKEINMGGRLFDKKRNITSVYFGGGTPALMLDGLGEIVNAIKDNFNINQNIGIELHPRDISRENLKRLRSIGFDMASIGIQSFQEECLKELGREHIDGAAKVRMAGEVGFKTIDVDLIFGIANQTETHLREDFLTAFDSGATQVSTYPFIDFSYANNKSKPLGKRDKKELLECLEAVSRESDCIRTSVWTFGKRNMKKYSSITRDIFIGFGPSATSLSKDFFKVNTFSVQEYIKCVNEGRFPTALTMKFTERTRALYWMFWNAYTLKLSNKAFFKLFNKNLEDMFGVELKLGRLSGLLARSRDGYELTQRGAYIYHLIEQNYTHQYIDKTWRIAGMEAWPKSIDLY